MRALVIRNGAFLYIEHNAPPATETEPVAAGVLDFLTGPSDEAKASFAGLEAGWKRLEEWGFQTKAGTEADGTPIKMATPAILDAYHEWLTWRDKWRAEDYQLDALNGQVERFNMAKRNAAEWEQHHDHTTTLGADGDHEVKTVEDKNLATTVARTVDEKERAAEAGAKNLIDKGLRAADDGKVYVAVAALAVATGIGIAIVAKRGR